MAATDYLNPVYPGSFPDPFVLKFRGQYWAYCTGWWRDGRAFGVLRSRDLVHWSPQAGALAPLAGDHPCYWAPEVVYLAGRFHLYYSVGDEERMEIRVAVAEQPAGPFEDSGRRLTAEPFAIDAHVFTDGDGSRWLFYATDFLEHSRIGTGTVRDRMLDPFTLEGHPRPVALPRHDWHVYHPLRPEKGLVRWHTVEGPFVLRRKNVYYAMFSAGNWQNPTYGVSYAVARSLAQPGEWLQAADGERVLPILRSGGEVVGPGHNSVIRGPDNRQLYCVYHRWSGVGARVMAIDPLDWAGERMLVLGPTTTPQPGPNPPTISDLLDRPAVLEPGEEIRYAPGSPSFLAEVSVRGGVRIALLAGDGRVSLDVSVEPTGAFRLLRMEVDGLHAALFVDGVCAWRGALEAAVHRVVLLARETPAELSGFALTVGWEDLFMEDGEPADRGWEAPAGTWRVERGRLRPLDSSGGWIARGPFLESYELVLNVRGEGWTVAPALASHGAGPRLTLSGRRERWNLAAEEYGQILPLPAPFDPSIDQQLRFRKAEAAVEISWEGRVVGAVPGPAGPARIALAGSPQTASFEAVRVTAIPPEK